MENSKIWPSADAKPLNRSSPNLKHVITSGHYHQKIRGQYALGFCPPYTRKTPKNVECLLHFFSSPERLQTMPLDLFYTEDGQTDKQTVIAI